VNTPSASDFCHRERRNSEDFLAFLAIGFGGVARTVGWVKNRTAWFQINAGGPGGLAHEGEGIDELPRLGIVDIEEAIAIRVAA
jgi:hypothetical protein